MVSDKVRNRLVVIGSELWTLTCPDGRANNCQWATIEKLLERNHERPVSMLIPSNLVHCS